MKKKMKRLIASVVAVVVLTCSVAITVTAADSAKASLHIVGLDGTLYYEQNLPVSQNGESLTVDKLLEIVKEKDGAPDITLTESAYGAYVSDINGIHEMEYGEMSGWTFRINNAFSPVGMSMYEIQDGDAIVVFYGDPYGVGMQFPEFDPTMVLETGVVTVRSTDITYDESWNEVITVNPVAGAEVTWDGSVYTSDENGEITVPKTAGAHMVSITRYHENGVPTVLAQIPGLKVFVSYADIATDDWFFDAVEYSVVNSFMTGSEQEFMPYAEMTQMELLEALYVLSGDRTGEVETWAVNHGIIGTEEFNPEGSVTREEFIQMLYNTLELTKSRDMTARSDITEASDYNQISEQYVDAISWAVATEIIIGINGNILTIAPEQQVTRAQVCRILYNIAK